MSKEQVTHSTQLEELEELISREDQDQRAINRALVMKLNSMTATLNMLNEELLKSKQPKEFHGSRVGKRARSPSQVQVASKFSKFSTKNLYLVRHPADDPMWIDPQEVASKSSQGMRRFSLAVAYDISSKSKFSMFHYKLKSLIMEVSKMLFDGSTVSTISLKESNAVPPGEDESGAIDDGIVGSVMEAVARLVRSQDEQPVPREPLYKEIASIWKKVILQLRQNQLTVYPNNVMSQFVDAATTLTVSGETNVKAECISMEQLAQKSAHEVLVELPPAQLVTPPASQITPSTIPSSAPQCEENSSTLNADSVMQSMSNHNTSSIKDTEFNADFTARPMFKRRQAVRRDKLGHPYPVQTKTSSARRAEPTSEPASTPVQHQTANNIINYNNSTGPSLNFSGFPFYQSLPMMPFLNLSTSQSNSGPAPSDTAPLSTCFNDEFTRLQNELLAPFPSAPPPQPVTPSEQQMLLQIKKEQSIE